MKSIVAIGLIIFAPTVSSFAQTKKPSDRMDLQKIEEKYWSAKDTDISVVQNRTYNKSNRFFLSLGYGPLMNDSWSTGRMTNASLGYYFSERMGFEIANEQGQLKDNDATIRLSQQSGIKPNYNTFKDYTSVNFIIVPFYAKMSFWDRKIMYFDMQFAFGVGQNNYIQKINPDQGGDKQKSAIGFNFDVTQQLFFHENFAVRLDIKNKFYQQDQVRYTIGVTEDESSRSLGKLSQQDTSILVGFTFFY